MQPPCKVSDGCGIEEYDSRNDISRKPVVFCVFQEHSADNTKYNADDIYRIANFET